jgi:hypothetical protein
LIDQAFLEFPGVEFIAESGGMAGGRLRKKIGGLASKLLLIAVEFFGGVRPRRSLEGQKTMHPDHFHILKNACLAAAFAVGAKMAIELAQYVVVAFD